MPKKEVDAWFDKLSKDQRPLLESLRKLVLSVNPKIVEEFKWGRPCYSGANGLVCYLHKTKDHATLGFYHAAGLKDPKKLLEGTGKDMRHIKIRSRDDIDEPAMKSLIKQAIAI